MRGQGPFLAHVAPDLLNVRLIATIRKEVEGLKHGLSPKRVLILPYEFSEMAKP